MGLNELLDSWMEMMSLAATIDNPQPSRKEKKYNHMYYEDRDKDIAFTIDMPGFGKKDINVKVENHDIKVTATNGNARD